MENNAEEMPTDEVSYVKWLERRHGYQITDKVQNHYEAVKQKIKSEFGESSLWQQLISNLPDYNYEYQGTKGYPLLKDFSTPELKTKDWTNFLDKTRRKNTIDNPNWPNEPPTGWILPSNWYSRIDDIVRTTIVVKYLDGGDFLADRIHSICGNHFRCDYEAKVEGYYAVHIYVTHQYDIPGIDWDTESIYATVEIQITTQIQDVLRQHLHKYYEERRGRVSEPEEKGWQWDPKSPEFIPNYLGHILHYVEGMIMEVRDREREYESV